MPTKARGPLMEDYTRALKAAKKAGVKAVRVEIGNNSAMIFALSDEAIGSLTSAASSEPAALEAPPHNWAQWATPEEKKAKEVKLRW